MVIYTPPSVAKDIPVIDLAESFSHDIEKRKAVAWEIHKAARQTGFFYIKNHGVPVELQKAYFDLAKEYFASPMDEKMQISSRTLSTCVGTNLLLLKLWMKDLLLI